MTHSTIPHGSRASHKGQRFSGRRVRYLVCLVSTGMSLTLAVVLDKQIRRRLHSSEYPDYGQYIQEDDSGEGGYFAPHLDILATGEFASQPIQLITNSQGFRNAKEFSYEVPDVETGDAPKQCRRSSDSEMSIAEPPRSESMATLSVGADQN